MCLCILTGNFYFQMYRLSKTFYVKEPLKKIYRQMYKKNRGNLFSFPLFYNQLLTGLFKHINSGFPGKLG